MTMVPLLFSLSLANTHPTPTSGSEDSAGAKIVVVRLVCAVVVAAMVTIASRKAVE